MFSLAAKKRNLYLAKGHLSPDADFIWQEWQDATYYYFNAAPQWQSINNGNWKAIEEAVRKYAYQKSANLKIFTGTQGQLSVGKRFYDIKDIFRHVGDMAGTYTVKPFQ